MVGGTGVTWVVLGLRFFLGLLRYFVLGVPTEATWMGWGGTGSTVLPGVGEGVLEGGGEEVLRLHMKVSQTKISTGFKSVLMRT